ncbi:NHL repeat-containing protein [Cryptosporangium sp. NPDC051539]|uniref:NHL repeat-containing protein n=1 Tax=Cryptosporangium sp. NPDC051539 TaxID=3363962 RepID=UPI0037987BD2
MRVRVIQPGTSFERPVPAPAARPDSYGPWRPSAVLGAPAVGGLLLPAAQPTASWLYAPRAVHVDDRRVVVADTGNHRVLVFDGVPSSDGAAADVVLGQRDAVTEGPQAAGAGPAGGMNLPTGVLVTPDGRLVVADAWNHRLLVWDRVPQAGGPPDLVLGQATPHDVEPNAGGEPSGRVFYWPFGIALVDGRFYVADTGNRRVLCWADGVPVSPDRPADVVLGQPDAVSRAENRGGAAGPDSFRWPHAVTGTLTGGVLVADAGNHRVLGWHAHPAADRAADFVLGQPDLTGAAEFPYRPQTPTGFRFPYGVLAGAHGLAVADTANNRVLIWPSPPASPVAEPAYVLGQPTFSANGENRWDAVAHDTLCWPYGLGAADGVLAVADSGNNRVVLWRRS